MWAGGLRRIDEIAHALTWWNRFEYIWTAVVKQWLDDAVPVEIYLRRLAEETDQWPDKWTLYLHGIHDENPHVWVDAPPRVWTYPGARITINDGKKVCACGATSYPWEEAVFKLATPIVIPVRQSFGADATFEPQEGDVVVRYNLDGLINRDVQ